MESVQFDWMVHMLLVGWYQGVSVSNVQMKETFVLFSGVFYTGKCRGIEAVCVFVCVLIWKSYACAELTNSFCLKWLSKNLNDRNGADVECWLIEAIRTNPNLLLMHRYQCFSLYLFNSSERNWECMMLYALVCVLFMPIIRFVQFSLTLGGIHKHEYTHKMCKRNGNGINSKRYYICRRAKRDTFSFFPHTKRFQLKSWLHDINTHRKHSLGTSYRLQRKRAPQKTSISKREHTHRKEKEHLKNTAHLQHSI